MSKTIMTVDDSSSIRQMVSFTLKEAGYDVVEAVDGKDALDKIKSSSINMLVTDLNMPIMDGISLIKEVRALPNFKFIPIIMLTTESQVTKKQEGRAAGATGWIVKPFKPEQLIAVTKKGVEMIDQHIQAFRDEALELLSELEDTLLVLEKETTNVELISRAFRALHTLKGSGGMFGFDDVTMFVHDIEFVFEQIRDGDIEFNKEIADLTLQACDQIKLMIFKSEKKQPDQEKVKLLIESFRNLASNFKSENEDKLVKKVTVSPEDKIKYCYKIYFNPASDFYLTGSDPLMLIDELNELGDFICKAFENDLPVLENIIPENSYLYWNAFLVTSKSIDTIKDVFIFVDDVAEINVKKIDIKINTVTEVLIKELESAISLDKEITAEELELIQNDLEITTKSINKGSDVQLASKENQSIRVNSDKLDELVNLVGELVTVQAGLSQYVAEIKDTKLMSLSEQIERLSWELRDSTLNIRMLPIGTSFSRFNRLIRDLSNELGKEVELITTGAETELDKNVLEKLNDPLIHILRNSIDHGIEMPEDRLRNGKKSKGKITLQATQAGGSVSITITDDGKGLNVEKIKTKALEKGLIIEGQELNDQDVYNLVFSAGFSTSSAVTNVSGRGVGMDVVKRSIDGLRGIVEIDSEEGKGTRINIKIPLTLAIIDGLLVRILDEHYVFPLSLVEECIELTRNDIKSARGRNIIKLRDEIIPYVIIRENFGIHKDRPQIEQVVITNIDGTSIGFVVDEVLGQNQTVLKTLGSMYRNVEGISGATILGDGTIALILDIHKLSQKVELEEQENLV